MKRLVMLVLGLLLIPIPSWVMAAPTGYILERSAPGVELWKKGQEFVQVIHLDQSAQVIMLQQQEGSGNLFHHRMMTVVWNEFATNPRAFSVCNGQFFTGENPGRLAFSLKVNGSLLTGGSEMSTYTQQKVALKLWSGEVLLQGYSASEDTDHPLYLLGSSAANGLIALSETAAHPDRFNTRGRTFAGCADPTPNNRYRTLFLYSTDDTPGVTQAEAAAELRGFGAVLVMMLDGGGSSQMRCQGETYVASIRPVPHFIGVLAADNTPPSTPTGVTANPSSCTPTNSFSFSWNPSSDGGSGVKGYHWKVNNGLESFTTALSIPAGSYATQQGTNTFYVRAEDNAGNSSGTAFVSFCWLPPQGPNLSFEDDILDPVGIPDGWFVPNLAGYSYAASGSPDPNGPKYVQFIHVSSSDQNSIGRAINTLGGAMVAGQVYRLSFWYRTDSTANFEWQVGGSTLSLVALPLADNEWHHFWSEPFSLTQNQIDTADLTFLYGTDRIGTVGLDWVAFEPQSSCQ